ncbi:hypothetical protein SLS62_004544 [Diatrype stigma]|uniref:Chitin-binding type-4 domain-containing protein n=1 Tax=Diatrype stigma TaxID=117547 RepID=A0AAN9YTA0_9PEZI
MRAPTPTPAALLATALLLPSLAHSHGLIRSPAPRAPGAATTAACGPKIAGEIASDPTSHVEGLPELGLADGAAFDPARCNVWLCKGLQFADNSGAGVQAYAPGESVPIAINLAIPHAGSANVSIVDTAANAVVGAPLIAWPSGYADEKEFYAGTTPADQTDFSVTIPEDLGGKCAEPGACVIQWWWYGEGAKQTYESCIDFVVSEA